MIYGGFFSRWFHQRPLGTIVVRWGGASIEVHPGLEECYLSLDRHYAIDLEWEHGWFYAPNNEQPPLLTFSHDRLCPNTPESWSRPLTMSEPHHLRLLFDAMEDLKD